MRRLARYPFRDRLLLQGVLQVLAQACPVAEVPGSDIIYFMDWRPCSAQDDLYAWAKGANNVELVRSRHQIVAEKTEGQRSDSYRPGENVKSADTTS
jgi:hypothetical protein